MTNKTTAALKLAEEALLAWKYKHPSEWPDDDEQALAAIREALAEQEKQEPVAYPNLQPVINWLENRCDPKEAAKELRIYQEQMKASPVSAPAQEPVAYVYARDVAGIGMRKDVAFTKHVEVGTDLYAAPVSAKREWVELTDDEIAAVFCFDDYDFARAVIAAYKEKNK